MPLFTETRPSAYLTTYRDGKQDISISEPIFDATTHESVDALYKKDKRKGFTDEQIIAFAGAQDAHPAVQQYVVHIARKMMHELQRISADHREFIRPELPEYLKNPFPHEHAA